MSSTDMGCAVVVAVVVGGMLGGGEGARAVGGAAATGEAVAGLVSITMGSGLGSGREWSRASALSFYKATITNP